jgi:hypothetical protein
MKTLLNSRWVPSAAILFLGMAICLRPAETIDVIAQDAEPAAVESPEPAPPADQKYIGSKKCSACHFDQYMKWRKTAHAKSFELLPAKYQADQNCLKCHTTGFGKPGGFKTAADNDLKGTGCEDCHGPGSEHAEISKPFATQKPTPEQQTICRDSIWKMLPKNVCVECHVVQGHHDSLTPKELQKK